ncbi:HK97-gp10 family putative phage morphogenesis protein [Eleftheria terrae]|uniref:HK97-gp10 family putative phage morphogenesis protein n=1 Tax=Eleftheria terrae TaxID=1597781 RepID=UPI00263A8F3C|nr:HK97-gp10 family putative phage morphogenesis protein [Eleftheria terrae]WKB52309.1 HK97 gp10 family phage protein [Eleftheria terrae]
MSDSDKSLREAIWTLLAVPDELRKRGLRAALAAGARVVRDEAKRHAPVLGNERQVPHRTSGTMRNAITVRTSKVARKAGDVGVFVNVRPARKEQRGAKSPTDPYYWRWVEFGSKRMEGRAFLQQGAQRLGEALAKFIQVAAPVVERLNRKK